MTERANDQLNYIPRRRIAITGLGLVTPLGLDVQSSWSNLIAGETGVRDITGTVLGPYANVIDVKLGAPVEGFDLMNNPLFAGSCTYVGHPGKYNEEKNRTEPKVINLAKERKNFHLSHELAIEATYQAIGYGQYGAGLLLPQSLEVDQQIVDHEKLGAFFATGLAGGDQLVDGQGRLEAELRDFLARRKDEAGIKGQAAVAAYAEYVQKLRSALDQPPLSDDEIKRLSSGQVRTYDMQQSLTGRPAEIISMLTGARAFAKMALGECAASTEAIADAADQIMLGRANVVIAGGCEAVMRPIEIQAFARHRGAVSPGDDPDRYPNPCDINRNGFVFGMGGAALVLEELNHAKARGAHIYAELVGWGTSADSYDPVEPDPRGIKQAFANALEMAGIKLDEISEAYDNQHWPGTPADLTEAKVHTSMLAPEQVVGINSTKASTGHMLGATGAAESIFTTLAIHDSVVPPARNLKNPEDAIKNYPTAAGEAIQTNVELGIKTNSGFGGHNATVILKKYREAA